MPMDAARNVEFEDDDARGQGYEDVVKCQSRKFIEEDDAHQSPARTRTDPDLRNMLKEEDGKKERSAYGKAATGPGSTPGHSIGAGDTRSRHTTGRRAKITALLHPISPRHAKTVDLHQVLHLRSPERADPAHRRVHKARLSSADYGSLGDPLR
ncbi:hypothetical protein ON010_g18161 [Phytophthora cinnamomi]|nr:hypothetical protein ON010_g18161 [Phytophthora cinnamomi]